MRLMSSLLFGVKPVDLVTYAVVSFWPDRDLGGLQLSSGTPRCDRESRRDIARGVIYLTYRRVPRFHHFHAATSNGSAF
jgi:hypothetical protein